MLRKNIPHFKYDARGPIYVNDPFMKIDGAGAEIMIDEGVFFMRTSRSEWISRSMQFIEFGQKNFPENVERLKRCQHYAEIFELLKTAFKNITYSCRFRVELQYVPMALRNEPNEDVITFVNVPYYKKNIGSLLSVWLLDDYRWPIEILENNTAEIKFYSTTLIPYKVMCSADILKMYENTLKIYSPTPEGIVFTNNGKQYKLTFDQFKEAIRKQ